MKENWSVILTEEFSQWLFEQGEEISEKILGGLYQLNVFGPHLRRPRIGTLKKSKYKNLKEMVMQVKGHPYRIFFLFNENREAIVLCGKNKKGINDKDFYREMIPLAEKLYREEMGIVE